MSEHQVGVCSWSLAPESPAALVEALRRVGIDAVQLALVPVAESPAAWADAASILRDAGIKVLSGMLGTVGEDYSTLESIKQTGGVAPTATWSATRDRAARVADVAAAAEIELVTMHAGFIPDDPADPVRPTLLHRLREIGSLMASRGLRLGLETGQEEAATLLSALDELAHPAIGVNFDPANMLLYDMGDPVAAVRTLGQYVVQVHIKDARRTTTTGEWGTEVPVGEGEVDWPRFLAAVDEVAPAVDLVIEREAGATREADIATARTHLQRWLGREAGSGGRR